VQVHSLNYNPANPPPPPATSRAPAREKIVHKIAFRDERQDYFVFNCHGFQPMAIENLIGFESWDSIGFDEGKKKNLVLLPNFISASGLQIRTYLYFEMAG
jgi:hypothetical protein